jgi:hypothetical protein
MGGNCFGSNRGFSKKIVGLGENSLHWQIAALAVETGISPRELTELEPRMLWTMGRYVVARSQAMQRKR